MKPAAQLAKPVISPGPRAYVPTPAEFKVVAKLREAAQQAKPAIAAKLDKTADQLTISWRHPQQDVAAALWIDAVGSTDPQFAATLLRHLAEIARVGPDLEEADLNAALALLRSLAPADPIETLLATQMVAIHITLIATTRRLANAENLAQHDSVGGMLNRLARTFSGQVEALKRHRTKTGEQKIIVQHINVGDGGQAVVGDVHGAGGSLKSEKQSHEPLQEAHASGAALLGDLEAEQAALSGAGDARQARMPLPRGSRGGTERSSQRRLQARQ